MTTSITTFRKKRATPQSAFPQKRNRPTGFSKAVDAVIFPSGIQRILKTFFSPPLLLLSHLHAQSTFFGSLAWPATSTLRLAKHTGQVTKGQATASPSTVSVAELLRERSWVRRKSEFKQEELYRELYLILADSAGWSLTAESTSKFHNFSSRKKLDHLFSLG